MVASFLPPKVYPEHDFSPSKLLVNTKGVMFTLMHFPFLAPMYRYILS